MKNALQRADWLVIAEARFIQKRLQLLMKDSRCGTVGAAQSGVGGTGRQFHTGEVVSSRGLVVLADSSTAVKWYPVGGRGYWQTVPHR